MLKRSRFRDKWCEWIDLYIITTFFCSHVNGFFFLFFFEVSRDLRQSGPLFSLLFFVVMKILNKILLKVRELELFKCLKVGEDELTEEVTHLFFLLMTLKMFS